MSEARDEMIAALRKLVIPVLRDKGFTGSFPHFRRIQQNQIDLLSFQFNRHGGSFVIEVSSCEAEGFTTYWGKFIPPNKVTAQDIHPDKRPRLGSPSLGKDGKWFSYESKISDVYGATAREVLPLLETYAEPYWQASRPL